MNICRFESAPQLTHATDIRGFLAKNGRALAGLEPCSADITQMDANVNRDLIELFLTILREELGLKPWYIQHILDSFFSPWIANGIWHQRQEDLPHIRGDWHHPDLGWEQRINSLASGTQLTTAVGCAAVVSVTVAAMVSMGLIPKTERAVADYLKWHNPEFKLNDMSDDVLHWISPGRLEKVVRELPGAIKANYSGFDVSFDAYPSFLSNQIVKDPDTSAWKAVPDIARGLTKTLCPESDRPTWYETAKRAYNSERLFNIMGVHGTADPEFLRASTKYPSYGLLLRNTLYSQIHPEFSHAWEILADSISRFNPETIPAIYALAEIEKIAVDQLAVDPTNVADIEFLLDPTKAQYKFTRDEISDGLFRTEYSSIDPSFLTGLKKEALE